MFTLLFRVPLAFSLQPFLNVQKDYLHRVLDLSKVDLDGMHHSCIVLEMDGHGLVEAHVPHQPTDVDLVVPI